MRALVWVCLYNSTILLEPKDQLIRAHDKLDLGIVVNGVEPSKHSYTCFWR